MKKVATFLASTVLFKEFSKLELEAVLGFLKPRSYAKDATLFQEGEPGKEMFIVLEGKISSFARQADGSRRKIYEFSPGRFFGEMAIIESAPRSATCLAEQDSKVMVLPADDFYQLVNGYPMIGLKILTAIGNTMTAWLDETSLFLKDLNRWGETARRRAVEDALTGLFNRRFLEESLHDRFAVKAAVTRPFSLIMMDLDRFRNINTLFGSAGGDKTIKAVADALRPALREGDVAAHLAGDEFAFLLPDTDFENAVVVADRIRTNIEKMNLILPLADGSGEQKVAASASLGVAVSPLDGDNPELLMAAADKALYRAKEKGRNQVSGTDLH